MNTSSISNNGESNIKPFTQKQVENKPLVPEKLEIIKKTFDQQSGCTTFQFKMPEGWSFTPGQYIKLGGRIPLAIASGKEELNKEQIFEVTGKPWKPGPSVFDSIDHVEVTQPEGNGFPMDKIEASSSVLLIAGGTGLTPLRSIMHSAENKENMQLFYGIREEKDIIYKEEVEEIKGKHVICLSRAEVKEGDGYHKGHVTDHFDKATIQPDTVVCICGPTPLIKSTIEQLVEKGVKKENIYASIPVAHPQGPVFSAESEILEKFLRGEKI